MKKDILNRYACTEDGKFIIDITAGKIEYLYNDFDKHAPYVRKELDQNLVDYIIECAKEIGEEKILIQFRFDEQVNAELIGRIKTSIKNYFLYLKELEILELNQLRRRSFLFFFIGIVIMMISVWVNDQSMIRESAIGRVFSEGLTVAAWVSLWESIAMPLISWVPHRRQISQYQQIADAPIQFVNAELNNSEINKAI